MEHGRPGPGHRPGPQDRAETGGDRVQAADEGYAGGKDPEASGAEGAAVR